MSSRVVDFEAFRERRRDPWVSKRELAAFFSVSARTVDRWVLAGCPVLKSYPGSWPRFRRLAVQDWLESRS